jgi:hypothetical protein
MWTGGVLLWFGTKPSEPLGMREAGQVFGQIPGTNLQG